MSWDVYLIKSATNDEANPDEIENPLPIATKTEIRDWLQQYYPEKDFTDENTLVLFEEDYSVEFVLYDQEQQNEVMLIIQGNKAPYVLIEEICRKFGCRAVDTGNGGFLEDRETSSFEEWKEFREEVKAEYETESEGGLRRILNSVKGWFSGR